MNAEQVPERYRAMVLGALVRHALLARVNGRVYMVALSGTVWDEEDVQYSVTRESCSCGGRASALCDHMRAFLYGSDSHTWKQYASLKRKRKLPKPGG